MIFLEYSSDFRIAFVAYSLLLGALFLLLGIVLATCASKCRSASKDKPKALN